jgi:hypothetical protein
MVIQAPAVVTMTGLRLLDGRAPSNADRHGGCLRVLGQVALDSVRFEGCRSRTPPLDSATPGGDGAAVQVAGGATLTGNLLVFANNLGGTGALSSNFPGGSKGGRGGALAVEGTATLSRTTFSGNLAGNGGGPTGPGGEGGALFVPAGGTLRVDGSTLSGNRSGDGASFMGQHGPDGRGGAAWCAGDCTFNNVTISGNAIGSTGSGTAAIGGGLAVEGGTTRLRNVTVAGNTANGVGGGIARVTAGEIRPRNSVFANNTGASSNHDCNSAAGGVVSEGYNLIRVNNGCANDFGGTDQEGTAAAPLDPLLGALAANGGPTETRALGAGSPAIDGGDPTGCEGWDGSADFAFTEDQRGFSRTTDGDGDTVATCDVGAYEAAEVPPDQNDLQVTVAGTPGGGTVTSSPAGIDCPGDCDESYVFNETVELTAAAAADHQFTGWSGACTGTGACSFDMSVDRNVTATFLALRDLDVTLAGGGTGTVTSTPAGIACPGVCSFAFLDGQGVTLDAAPNPDSLFLGWSGDCSGASCSVTMGADRDVTATFLLRAIFLDGFASGDYCAWSGVVGAPPCPP